MTLNAAGDWKSLFANWSGGFTSSANPVTFTMDANKTVTATFNPNLKVKLTPGGTSYASIQEAYSSVSSGTVTIQAQVYSFLEDLLFGNSTDVILLGGLDSNYQFDNGIFFGEEPDHRERISGGQQHRYLLISFYKTDIESCYYQNVLLEVSGHGKKTRIQSRSEK